MTNQASAGTEAGPAKRVLLVEDNFMVALALEAVLLDGRCTIVGPFGVLAEAVAAAETEVLDGAVLDFDLGGEAVTPVIQVLSRRGVPFLILSGHMVTDTGELGAAGILRKPVSRVQLQAALDRLFGEPGENPARG